MIRAVGCRFESSPKTNRFADWYTDVKQLDSMTEIESIVSLAI
jgi:hypothetical protein